MKQFVLLPLFDSLSRGRSHASVRRNGAGVGQGAAKLERCLENGLGFSGTRNLSCSGHHMNSLSKLQALRYCMVFSIYQQGSPLR